MMISQWIFRFLFQTHPNCSVQPLLIDDYWASPIVYIYSTSIVIIYGIETIHQAHFITETNYIV